MRTGTSTASKPALYDRSPTTKRLVDGNSVGPSAFTVLASYECPQNKIAILNSCSLSVRRISAAGTPGLVSAVVTHQATSVGAHFDILRTEIVSNGVGDTNSAEFAPAMSITAGQVINIAYNDLSTTGTVARFLSAFITEFDT